MPTETANVVPTAEQITILKNLLTACTEDHYATDTEYHWPTQSVILINDTDSFTGHKTAPLDDTTGTLVNEVSHAISQAELAGVGNATYDCYIALQPGTGQAAVINNTPGIQNVFIVHKKDKPEETNWPNLITNANVSYFCNLSTLGDDELTLKYYDYYFVAAQIVDPLQVGIWI